MQNIVKKYQTQTEQAFGVLRFENGKPETGSKGIKKEILDASRTISYITKTNTSATGYIADLLPYLKYWNILKS